MRGISWLDRKERGCIRKSSYWVREILDLPGIAIDFRRDFRRRWTHSVVVSPRNWVVVSCLTDLEGYYSTLIFTLNYFGTCFAFILL